ncbi:MAG TPA: NAD-dependent epimerase/dehydratase family protein [Gemmatimonadales bacterium]|nr:NAD-dependent epimerase/dehydratase family protein [Gemmatimonadales bacterium]
MSRYLVTGAAGFIGSHVCDALLDRGDTVVGVDNFDAAYPRAVKEHNVAGLRGRPGFELIEADLTGDPLPIGRVAAVVHLAARAGVRASLEDPAAYVRANVGGTARVLDLARTTGVERVVLGSSSSVYGLAPLPFVEDAPAAPRSPYAATKRAAELLAEAYARVYGLRVAMPRLFSVYGPRQRPDLAIYQFTERIAQGRAITVFGDGSSERDYTYIKDGVAGIVAALDWTARAPAGECSAINIGGGEPVRLDRVIALVARAVGREAVIERLPEHPGEVRATAADLCRARRELGYCPRVGIEEGIEVFVRWYEARHGRQS